MLPRFFIDRPIFAWVIAIIIVLAGLLALRGLPVAQYPEVAPPGAGGRRSDALRFRLCNAHLARSGAARGLSDVAGGGAERGARAKRAARDRRDRSASGAQRTAVVGDRHHARALQHAARVRQYRIARRRERRARAPERRRARRPRRRRL